MPFAISVPRGSGCASAAVELDCCHSASASEPCAAELAPLRHHVGQAGLTRAVKNKRLIKTLMLILYRHAPINQQGIDNRPAMHQHNFVRANTMAV